MLKSVRDDSAVNGEGARSYTKRIYPVVGV